LSECNTENAADYERFKTESAPIYNKLKELRELILNDNAAYEKIRQKYQTKNTVGYSVNAFIDFEEPMDIMAHLLVGAEGTLGFIAEAVLQTVPDYPEKLTGMLYFSDIYMACQAIRPLTNAGAAAVELMDRASLQSIENMAGMPEVIKTLPENAAALLVEFQGNTQDELKQQMDAFMAITHELSLLHEAEFTAKPAEQAAFWKVRKGMFPAVGAVRASGTSVILEDVAFPVDSLGDAITDLQDMFKQHGYQVPTTWQALMSLSAKMATDMKASGGKPWCGGIGSGTASGWPATDWLEEVVLGTYGGQVYDDWISHKVKFTVRFRGRDSYESNDFSTPRSTMCSGIPCCFHVSINAQSIGLRNKCLPRRRTNASSISVK